MAWFVLSRFASKHVRKVSRLSALSCRREGKGRAVSFPASLPSSWNLAAMNYAQNAFE